LYISKQTFLDENYINKGDNKLGDNMKPLRDEVVVRQQSKDNKTEAGIILTTDEVIKENVGEVIALGKDADELAIGDKVLFGPGFVVQHIDKQEVLFMSQKNILCVL